MRGRKLLEGIWDGMGNVRRGIWGVIIDFGLIILWM